MSGHKKWSELRPKYLRKPTEQEIAAGHYIVQEDNPASDVMQPVAVPREGGLTKYAATGLLFRVDNLSRLETTESVYLASEVDAALLAAKKEIEELKAKLSEYASK